MDVTSCDPYAAVFHAQSATSIRNWVLYYDPTQVNCGKLTESNSYFPASTGL